MQNKYNHIRQTLSDIEAYIQEYNKILENSYENGKIDTQTYLDELAKLEYYIKKQYNRLKEEYER